MANDDGRLFFYSVIGFGAGVYTFFKGFREFRKYRLLADTPEIRIRSIPMGLVQVRGQAQSRETLLSPLTRTPCCLYKVVMEEWHSGSGDRGEWKHAATDLQKARFYLEDASGKVLVDPTDAELDLPHGPVREVRSHALGGSFNPGAQASDAAQVPGTPATDQELLHYITWAKLRHYGQMAGRVLSAVSPVVGPAHQPQRQSLLNFLADPTGAAGEGFAGIMMKAMVARQDPNGEIRRAALEAWKHPPGSPAFQVSLDHLVRIYARAMPAGRHAGDPAAMLAKIQQNPDEVMRIAAMVAAAADPQADPESERARQLAAAYAHERPMVPNRVGIQTASGHFRLTEYCLVPGQMYDVTGTCAENPQPRDEHDRNIIIKGVNEPTFLISWRTGADVQSWLWRQSLGMVLGGAGLAIVCLAIVLWKLGLF